MAFRHTVPQWIGLFCAPGEAAVLGIPELRRSLKEDYTTRGMRKMDVENQFLDLSPNESAPEQEEEPASEVFLDRSTQAMLETEPLRATANLGGARVNSRQRFLTASWKKAVTGTVICLLILGPVLFFLGTLVPLNHQQDTIKCPPDWIGHQGYCYRFSGEEKNWKESQNFCVSHDASLAKITKEEMAIVRMFTRYQVFWIGLKREPDQPWKWLDGENSTLEVMGNGGDCAYLDDDTTASSGRCTTKHRYICKKN